MSSKVSDKAAHKLPTPPDPRAVLEQYVDLEKRVTNLEHLVNSQHVEKTVTPDPQQEPIIHTPSPKKGNQRDPVFDEKPSSNSAEEGPRYQTSKSRYRHVVNRWNGNIGGRDDYDIGNIRGARSKGAVSETAFTFRKVMDLSDDKKLKYSEVDIEDRELRDLLKKVIGESYPDQSWEGNITNMIAPFAPIIHNWAELVNVCSDESEDSQARDDLRKLLDLVKSSTELQDYFKTRDSNLQSNKTTYETMWTLFRPGTRVIARPFMNLPQIFEVKSSPDPYGKKNLGVECWCYDWTGKEMVKAAFDFRIEKFRGTKDISSLFCYPLKYYKEENGDFDQNLLIKRGQKFVELCTVKKGAEQMFSYDDEAQSIRGTITRSPTIDQDDLSSKTAGIDEGNQSSPPRDYVTHKRFKVKGKYIIDAAAYLQFGPGIAMLGKFSPIDVEPVHQAPDEFLLYPPRVLGYATEQKMWGQFKVDSTIPIQREKDRVQDFEKSIFNQKLELDQNHKDMIWALVKNHESSKTAGAAHVNDVIEGKGNNLVILLHGPPGVGKTLTAELIAEATRKPLFVVSVAEIGLDASKAEMNLEKMFYLAGKWEAILLVDEADIFLESRFIEGDANRNALVSVLLRVLEYYEGIIILTTNRITSLDVAVQSRIHLAIRYDDLTKQQKTKIFNNFLGDLASISGIKAWVDMAGSEAELNGRQIRNIVSAAQVLAHSKGQELSYTHLKTVTDTTRKFQKQLEKLTLARRGQNEVVGS